MSKGNVGFSVGLNGTRVTIAIVGAHSVRTNATAEIIKQPDTITIFFDEPDDVEEFRDALTRFLESDESKSL